MCIRDRLSAEWYQQNKKRMGNIPILKITNLVIKGAVGKKSNKITQQTMLEVRIGEYVLSLIHICCRDK